MSASDAGRTRTPEWCQADDGLGVVCAAPTPCRTHDQGRTRTVDPDILCARYGTPLRGVSTDLLVLCVDTPVQPSRHIVCTGSQHLGGVEYVCRCACHTVTFVTDDASSQTASTSDEVTS